MQRLISQHSSSGDIHPAFVKAGLEERGVTLTALALRHHKEASYFRAALQKPFPKAMRLLAKALKQRPHELWPSLFDENDEPIKRLRRYESTPRRTLRGGRHPI